MDNPPIGLPSEGTLPHQPVHQPMQSPYRFTQEELRVIRQCNAESFYQRCLPLGTALGIGAYLGVQAGYLKPSARWGATPKVMLGVVVGYFLGKFSYQSKCAEKIMHLPNSPLGEMLRRNKYGGSKEILSIDPSFGVSLAPFGNIETYSDIGPQHDIDVDRPYQQGLDDSGRPSLDSSMLEDDDLSASAQNHTTTYDELRRKNREEYEQKKPKPYRGEEGQPIFRPRPTPPPDDAGPSSPFPQPRERHNKYGDVWEK